MHFRFVIGYPAIQDTKSPRPAGRPRSVRGLGWLFRHSHVIHFVGDTLVTKSLKHLGAVNKEDAGQLKGVADDSANAVGKHDSVAELPLPDLEPEQLGQGSAPE